MKNNKIIEIAAIIVTVSLIAFFIIITENENKKEREIKTTVENCIKCICDKENDSYFKYSAGDVLFKIHNIKYANKVEIEDIKIEKLEIKGDFCKVKCRTDLKLADGSFDVFWNEMELINKGSWKVIETRTSKTTLDKEEKRKKYDTEIFTYIVKEFTKEYDRDKKLATRKYTAGEQRQSIEYHREYKEDKFGEIEIKEVRCIHRGELTAKIDIKYIIEGKEVNNLFTFYRTKEGWKITEIQSSFFKEGK